MAKLRAVGIHKRTKFDSLRSCRYFWCVLFCGFERKRFSRAKAEPRTEKKTMGEGARGEGKVRV